MAEFYKLTVAALCLLFGGFLLTGSRRRYLYVLYRTLPRDLLAIYRFIRIHTFMRWCEWREYTVAKIFSNYAKSQPEKIAYFFEDEKWTYLQMEHLSNRIGRYFRTKSLSRGDSVAVFMENCPEYIAVWLGLSKIGLVSALINTNLRHDVLVHSIRAANCKAIIYGAELKEAISAIKHNMPELQLYQWSKKPTSLLEGATDVNEKIKDIESKSLAEVALGKPRHKLIYIYTSGTTGMPKAAVISNLRFMLIVNGVAGMFNIRLNDRVYDPLPLYHSAGGILGAGQALLRGVTVVLRKKFSASKFWEDCVRYECTTAQYIGEICRFLLTVPSNQYDKIHKVRMMFGNGLKPQIWEPFVKRFGIKQMAEFYGATEGNSNLVNIDNTVGAVGFLPTIARSSYPLLLLKVDEETGEILRRPDGLCIQCKPGEPGVLVGKIELNNPMKEFSGYADKKASEQKIIHNVLTQGDRAFNSGDLLVMDEYGYFYFKDRTGDTFRWRGENVATSEVEAVISNVMGLKDAVVYGVEIPGAEGRAGMAAIYEPSGTLDTKKLAEGLKESLPTYARPLFIRLLAKLPMTGTFKLQKKDLRQEAFDIKKIKDPLYFFNNDSYVKMTDELYNDIVNGKYRF